MLLDENTVIAIVEDEDDLRCNTELFLRSRGYQVWAVESAEALYKQLVTTPADVILVDINLPGEDGFLLIEHLRDSDRYILIAMTARIATEDRIKGLNSGANMYFMKPVDLEELEAGIRSALRRVREAIPRPIDDESSRWTLNLREFYLQAPNGGNVKLTGREMEVLSQLMRNAGQVIDKKNVTQPNDDQNGEDLHRIDSLLYRLRKKVESELQQVLPIRAVFGKGYAFTSAAVVKNDP
jgi:DNA-binding response OmpR family regulator